MEFLRKLSLAPERKPEQGLTQNIRLREVTLGLGEGRFTESQKTVAELPPLK